MKDCMTYVGLNKEFEFNEKISNVILLFLLLVRLSDQYFPAWIFGAHLPNWFPYWYAGIMYILTAVIVWLNRHRLSLLNIDRPFIVLLILGGVLYIFFLSSHIGVLVGITAGFIFWAYVNNHFVIKSAPSNFSRTWLLVLMAILLAFLQILFRIPTIKFPVEIWSIITIFFSVLQMQLAGIVFEDVIFRGALWAYLRSLGLSDQTVLFLQAFLFLISHHRYLTQSPYFFWMIVPLVAILLGYIVLRSKSLFSSTIAHALFNFISRLIKELP